MPISVPEFSAAWGAADNTPQEAYAVERGEPNWVLSTQSAEARVARFLRTWADAQSDRGQDANSITLRMSRAEIGNFLGLTVETISRALARLARRDLIRFDAKCRRTIHLRGIGPEGEIDEDPSADA